MNLLNRLHALMSDYLVEECPEEEFYEDFAPEIDRLCDEVDTMRGEEGTWLANLPTESLSFIVEIQFLSGGQLFAAETHEVEAFDWTTAKSRAFRLADESPYDNERIPDLTRQAVDRTGEHGVETTSAG